MKHIELSSGFFEHLDDSDEVLVTSFTTHGTPLIRYRIGDRMHFDDRESFCSCHLHSPEVSSIEGRRLDFLYTATGAKITTANMANMMNIPILGLVENMSYLECPHCGKRRAFCSRSRIQEYKCDCGEKTELHDLAQIILNCECGSYAYYLTNVTDEIFDVACINCGTPIAVQYNAKKKLYETI